MTLTPDSANTIIRKIQPQSGSVILISYDPKNVSVSAIQQAYAHIKQVVPKGVAVLMAPQGDVSLSMVSPEELKKAGWYRSHG